MRARVADRVLVEVADVNVLVYDVELQHVHAGDAMTLAQGIHLRRYDAEVLGDDRQFSESLLHGVEYRVAGTRFPGAGAGGTGFGGHGPVGLEAAEMIDAHEVGELGRGAQPLDPPAIAGLPVILPVIQWVAPELPVFAEIVGRYTSDVAGSTFLVELQHVAIGPCIGAVEGNVDRHVAEKTDAFFPGVVPQSLPLVVEQALDDLDPLDFESGGPLELAKCVAAPVAVFRRPLRPGALIETRFQDPEQGIVVQPLAVVLRQEAAIECLEVGTRRLRESRRRQLEHPGLQGNQCAIVDTALRQGRQLSDLFVDQQPVVDQFTDVDQHLVAREGRQGLVR